jgi:hypothetical protein
MLRRNGTCDEDDSFEAIFLVEGRSYIGVSQCVH